MQTDTLFLDLSKAFDKVVQNRLMLKISELSLEATIFKGRIKHRHLYQSARFLKNELRGYTLFPILTVSYSYTDIGGRNGRTCQQPAFSTATL